MLPAEGACDSNLFLLGMLVLRRELC